VIGVVFDPVIRGPFFACALMGSLCALIGTLLFYQRLSLKGEALSHACYPGMVLGSVLAVVFDGGTSIWLFVCALLSSFLGAFCIDRLLKKARLSSDVALAAVLAASFSFSLLMVSAVQISHPTLWRSLKVFLVGQAATMGDYHIAVAFFLLLSALLFMSFFRRAMLVELFDRDFAALQGSRVLSSSMIRLLLVASIIVGVRFMGVILISAMFLIPPIIAKMLVNRFFVAWGLSALIGAFCGGSGVLISHFWSVSIPTGPLVCLLLTLSFAAVLLFSTRQGVVVKWVRRRRFTRRCQEENALKQLWKECDRTQENTVELARIEKILDLPECGTLVRRLDRKGFLRRSSHKSVEISPKGLSKGKTLVRLHRLWELYLVRCCHMSEDRVHPSAEQMEHILTAEVELELIELLGNPSLDPHNQPIPDREVSLGS